MPTLTVMNATPSPATLKQQAKPVDKEQVHLLRFVQEDVLSSETERQRRLWTLNRALTLGNIFKHKCKIYFMTTEGPRYVHTTIWALTERNVILKGGRSIPIHAIYHVSLI